MVDFIYTFDQVDDQLKIPKYFKLCYSNLLNKLETNYKSIILSNISGSWLY